MATSRKKTTKAPARKATTATAVKTKTGRSRAANAVQGEGDYVAARKYFERTRAFVRRMAAGQVAAMTGPKPTKAELEAAERKALARSRGRAGDKADARMMKDGVAASRTGSRRSG